MSLRNFLFGRSLASDEDENEKIGAVRGISIFGLDALGSAVYGPEAALTVFIPLAVAGPAFITPVLSAVVALLLIVFFSYRQTIKAYPSGGGTFTVASQNLGMPVGLVAAAALMIDYALTVAVGISAGVGALISMVPALQPYNLLICIFILAFITIVNARGVNDTGAVFSFPAYLFIFCMMSMLLFGMWKLIASGGHLVPMVNLPVTREAGGAITLWILLKAFSNGCTAMTGVEAVSNGVTTFKDPNVRTARITLSVVILTLSAMLIMIALLIRGYQIRATIPGDPGYRSVIYMVITAVTGQGWISYVITTSVLLVLVFQANTAFTGFPLLCRIVAQHGYLPQGFANQGRRLVYSHGIYVLAFLSLILLIIFGGVTDKLIPLFAVGALLAFTLSQAGMVSHWKKNREKNFLLFMSINGFGALATGVTMIIVIITKFMEGAWVVMILLPFLLAVMRGIHIHYRRVEKQLVCDKQILSNLFPQPLVILPAEEWNKNTAKALHTALGLSKDIIVLHIKAQEDDSNLEKTWRTDIEEPLKKSGIPVPELKVIYSPYRLIVKPIVDFTLNMEKLHPDRQIAVVVPTLVEKKWYQRFLHNQRAFLLMGLLMTRSNKRIFIINVPWYMRG